MRKCFIFSLITIISNFSCPQNSDIEQFLKQKALVYEKARYAKITLIFVLVKKEQKLVAYYTIALMTFELDNNLSSTSDVN